MIFFREDSLSNKTVLPRVDSQRKTREQINILMARMTINFTDRRYRFMPDEFGGKQEG